MTAVVDTLGVHGEAVPQITAAQMRDKLLTVDQLREKLALTEPIEQIPFGTGHDRVRFVFEDGWGSRAEGFEGTDPVDAYVSVGPVGSTRDFRMTLDAALEATSLARLPKKMAADTPAGLIEPIVNWAFSSGLPDKDFQILAVGEGENATASAIAKASVMPFSNLELLDRALEGIQAKYGSEVDSVLVDYKLQHSLRRTKFNLIIPEQVRVMERTGTEDDTWSAGLGVTNSLIGLEQTQFAGYLFRWWCTNGAIDTHASGGNWNRKAGQGDEVYEWARTTVDEILGGLDHSFDAVQALVDVPLEGSVVEVMRDIWKDYGVPAAERERIIENLMNTNQVNMYGVMQAITQVANRPEIEASRMNDLMVIGGDLPHTIAGRCENCHRIKHS